MPGASSDVIRHALRTARSQGYRRVRLKTDDISFTATLSDDFELFEEEAEGAMDIPSGPVIIDVLSTHVGYLRILPDQAIIGGSVKAGDRLAEIVALGIANEVSAPATGILSEILVANGEPVEYGQVIAKVKQ